MNLICSICLQEIPPEKMMKVDSGKRIYQFCPSCLKSSQELLSMKIAPNKEERKLLKNIRKFLKHVKN